MDLPISEKKTEPEKNPSTAKGSASIKMIESPAMLTNTSEKKIKKEIFFEDSN